MKIFTVRNIATFCDVDFGFIRRILDSNEMRPKVIFGNRNEKKGYSFYQLFLLKPILEQLIQKEINFDIDKEEVFLTYESKLNYE